MTSKNFGENNGQAKLTVEAVEIIRHLLRSGHQGKEIAQVYGLSKALISAIRNNKVWTAPVEQMEKHVGSSTSGHRFDQNDINTIVEEVQFLMAGGYRAQDKAKILRGLNRALKRKTSKEWKEWVGTPLRVVIDDLYRKGYRSNPCQ